MRAQKMTIGFTMMTLLLGGASEGSEFSPMLHLSKGDEFQTTKSVDSLTKISRDNHPFEVTWSHGTDMNYAVGGVDTEGVRTLVMTYAGARKKLRGPDNTMEYDSRKPPAEGADKRLWNTRMDPAVGQSILLKTDADGSVKSVEVSDATATNISKVMEPITSVKLPLSYYKMETKRMTDAYKDMIALLPKKPVNIGGSWPCKIRMPSQVGTYCGISDAVGISVKCTFIGHKKGLARIEMAGVLSPMNFEWSPEERKKIDSEIPFAMNGTMDIDEKTGWPMSSEINIQMRTVQTGDKSDPASSETIETHAKVVFSSVKK